ncbi:MAG: hypothetical protein DWQ04_16350 [Chloroflexi bacterium]|nr:MAG: hypothetical protein DWQ04_16350 [Chloroflexota bacterium]
MNSDNIDFLETFIEKLTLDNLRTICFKMEIDYETIDGSNKTAKARELTQYLERTNRVQDLLIILEEMRPNVRWRELYASRKVVIVKPQRERRAIHLWKRVFVSVVLIGFIGLGTLIYFRYFRHFAISPELTPSLFSYGEANADTVHYFAANPAPPSQLTWYRLDNRTLVDAPTLPIKEEDIDSYLYFQPQLNSPTSWAAIFFWHTLFIPPRNLNDNTETIIILHTEKDDFVEITFKDAHGNEEKLAMPVVSGWAGYRIPFGEAKSVDFNKLSLFEFAYARGVGSQDRNTFKIAQISFQ